MMRKVFEKLLSPSKVNGKENHLEEVMFGNDKNYFILLCFVEWKQLLFFQKQKEMFCHCLNS